MKKRDDVVELDKIDTFLLDMDGTIYLSDSLIDGAAEFLAELRRQGKKYIFITNNSSKNRYDYVEKLKRLGLDSISHDDVVTSGEAAAMYLREKYPGGKAYVLGTPSLERELTDAGFELVQERGKDIGFVLLGFDTTLTYEKIWAACDYIRSGTDFFATHPDVNCPLAGGMFMPDTGAMIAMFEASTGVSPQIIGKPNLPIISGILKKYGFKKEAAAIVGDRINTDVCLGKNAGITSVLVLSGATTAADYEKSDIKAEYVFDSVKDLLALINPETAIY